MRRINMLVIRLSQSERAAIDSLAARERLPVSTFARQLLLKEADQRGLSIPAREETDRRTNPGGE